MHSSLREDYGSPWAKVRPLHTLATAKAMPLSHCNVEGGSRMHEVLSFLPP